MNACLPDRRRDPTCRSAQKTARYDVAQEMGVGGNQNGGSCQNIEQVERPKFWIANPKHGYDGADGSDVS